MVTTDPVPIDLPTPIRTPRLTIRPKQIGDGAIAFLCGYGDVARAQPMDAVGRVRDAFTAESMEIRNRHVMASFLVRERIELIGIETQTGEAVVWCGLHDIDWQALQCDTGFGVRKSAQGRGNRDRDCQCDSALGVRCTRNAASRITHSLGNEPSRRIAERLSFALEGYSGGPICFLTGRQ
jgi:ribosomal-protein-serine acetyltransferase